MLHIIFNFLNSNVKLGNEGDTELSSIQPACWEIFTAPVSSEVYWAYLWSSRFTGPVLSQRQKYFEYCTTKSWTDLEETAEVEMRIHM